MIESIEMLGRLCNKTKPPLELEELEEIRNAYLDPQSEKTELRKKLDGMKKAFEGKGDVKEWDYEVLNSIDECFFNNFMDVGKVSPVAFVPGNVDGINRYIKYCDEVDEVLRVH